MNPEPSRSLETLLAQSDWVTRLARGLCADPADADDAVQAAWIDALRAPPSALRDPRAWLTTVVRRQLRKLQRSTARRRRHEAAGSVPVDTAPAADELAARVQTHRDLVDAVLALDEPYRATVVLRYFEHLDVDAIAARTQRPVNTVRSQLQRALQQLRERLDRAPGGRARWQPAVLALALRPLLDEVTTAAVGTGTGLATGIALAIPMKKLLLPAAVLAVSLFALWPRLSPSPDTPTTTNAPTTPIASATPITDPPVAGEPALQRDATPPIATSLAARGRRLADLAGQPLADVVLRAESPFAVRWQGGDRGWIAGDGKSLFLDAAAEQRLRSDVAHAQAFFAERAHPEEWRAAILGESLPARETRSANDGGFAFAAGLAADDASITVSDPRFVLLARGATDGAPWRAGPATRVTGVVVDEAGAPLADAFLMAWSPLDGGTPLPEDLETRTNARGEFLVRRALAGGLLRTTHAGCRTVWTRLDDTVAQQRTIVLARQTETERLPIDGLVVDPGGRPIGGASVWFGRERTQTDADGRFRFTPNAPQPRYALTVAAKGYALLQRDEFATRLLADAAAGRDVLCVLDPTQRRLRGLVLGIDGAPLAGARVDLVDPTLLDITFTGVEALLGGFDGGATTDRDGSFTLPGLSDRSYRVRAIDTRTGANATSAPWRPDHGDLVLRLADGVRRQVPGTVRRDGAPVTGATVAIEYCTHVTKGGGNAFAGPPAIACDGDGAFVLPVLPTRAAWLVARLGTTVLATLPVEALGPGALTIDASAQRWLQLVGSEHANERSVHFVFADDRLEVARSDGSEAKLARDGSIAPLRVPTGASSVVVGHGTAAARRLELTDDVAVHLRVP